MASKMNRQSQVEEQKFRKHLEAICVAIAFVLFFILFFTIVGSIVNWVTVMSTVSWFGWVAGSFVAVYLIYSGLFGDTFTFFITAAKNVANGIADGYYEEESFTQPQQ